MTDALVITETQILGHLGWMSSALSTKLDAEGVIQVEADWNVLPLVVGLVGDNCEFTARNRGAPSRTVPVANLGAGLCAWLGYREEWDGASQTSANKKYSFRSVALTVHFGYRKIAYKPQMFRAEWAGWARWGTGEFGYQAGTAGHPHWQFDALESLTRSEALETANQYLEILRSEEGDVIPREFLPQAIGEHEIGELVKLQNISRVHFASAAAWWRNSPDNEHAHSPKKIQDIQAWVSNTLVYVKSELARLV